MGLLFKDGTVVTASDMFRADVLVDGDKIALIGHDLPNDGHEIVPCAGKYLLPGGVDVHTHLHLPLAATAANSDFDSGHRAAAFGGTTTHIDMAVQPKGGSLIEGLRIWRDKAAPAQIDYSFHMTITDPTAAALAEVPDLIAEGIPSLKLLMAYKGTFMIDDVGLYQTMQAARRHGALVLAHAENGDAEYLIRQQLLAEGKTTPRYHPLSRPAIIEAEATQRAIAFAELTGCPLYIVHMTCRGALEALEQGRRRGVWVMGETCPQYLFLSAETHLADDAWEGAKYVCSPPLRTLDDQKALWSALASGLLHTVATDHCDFWFAGGVGPHQEWARTHDNHQWAAYEAQNPTYRRPGKELGKDNFALIPNGLPGIEERLKLLWAFGVNSGRLTPSRFVELNCTNPAKIFGLYPRKGALLPGADADILVWNAEAPFIIRASDHHMHTDYNPYEGMSGRGRPEQVYLRGQKIVEGDRWLGRKGAGRFIPRAPL